MTSKMYQAGRIRRESSTENVCTLCYHEANAWVVSPCDHHMCLTCAVRLRVLCEMKECPVCRENNEKVVVVAKCQPFSSISSLRMIKGHKHSFLFESHQLMDIFESLKTIHCVKCGQHQRFSKTKHLQDHLRKEHQLLMCEICVFHLKLFPHEHKLYTREQLAHHRREGDPGDSSHKGHPLCRFCEERFLDTDTLFFHLKDKHFWCHFCEADGKQDYYADYAELSDHFRRAHFLCYEGQCRYDKFTAVFRTKLDFQAHRARDHSKGLSKAEAKQLRHIEVGFVYSREDMTTDGMPSVSQRQYHSRKRPGMNSKEMEDIEVAKAMSVAEQQRKDNSSSSEESSPDPQPQLNDIHPLNDDASLKKQPIAAVTSHREEYEWPSLLDLEQPEAEPSSIILPDPPPGFAVTRRDKQKQQGIEKLKTENFIFETAQAILDNNKKKIGQFRNYSGLYQRGEITVEDYYGCCSVLFGSAWTGFGLQLAHTLPDPLKRCELNSMFDFVKAKRELPPPGLTGPPPGLTRPPPGLTQPPPGLTQPVMNSTTTTNKNRKVKSQYTSARPSVKQTSKVSLNEKDFPSLQKDFPSLQTPSTWESSLQRSKKVSLNEEEFPSLQKASKMPDPVTASPPGWNIKVAVK